jgi:hypothetical protein
MFHRIIMLGILFAAGASSAEPADRGPSSAEPAPIKHRINLRAGLATSDDVGRPAICLEVVTFLAVSVEGCGTGSGILHDKAGRQIAHFRANVPVLSRGAWGGRFALRGGLGFAELEVGPGFDFGVAENAVAGPDAAVSAQWLRPVGAGIELVANATAGVAWFQGARELVVPQSRFQPYVAFELGVGW